MQAESVDFTHLGDGVPGNLGNLATFNNLKQGTRPMKLGAFSVSLAVKDLDASIAFYEKLGFAAMGGAKDQGWQILKNDQTVIGLFQGMFDKNLMTFNPGWDQSAQNVDAFTDIRDIQAALKAAGLEAGETIDSESGPAHITLTDPDGNTILIDQHR